MSNIRYPAECTIIPESSADIIVPVGFEATCTALDLVGDPVIVSAPGEVTSFASNIYPDLCVGIIKEKSDSTTCIVVIAGILKSITTGLVANKAVFVSPTGGLTTTKPAAGHLQIMGTALSSTDMVVNVSSEKVIQS